ncbi:MAG: hypothetical protein PHU42_02090 [Patescibacteria group bacterium]|nr:hypothetical protein [Patescibacteria group bacterium]
MRQRKDVIQFELTFLWRTSSPDQKRLFCLAVFDVFFVLFCLRMVGWQGMFAWCFLAAGVVSVLAVVFALRAMISAGGYYFRYHKDSPRLTVIKGGGINYWGSKKEGRKVVSIYSKWR